MKQYKVLRAEETWQRAGAYSVRVQGMNRQHHISLREEFDEHDGDESKYIQSVLVGRVVVLPEYRGQHLGSTVIKEAEKWITELGYTNIQIDSRVVAVGFYEKLGYKRMDDEIIKSWSFDCVRMRKRVGETL